MMKTFSIENTRLRAAFWIIASGIFFTLSNASARTFSGGFPPLQLLFFQNFFAFLALLPIIGRYRVQVFSTPQLKAHSLRALIGVGGNILWFLGLDQLPLADMTALGLTGTLFITIGGIVIFKEKVTTQKLFLTVLGFMGAVLVAHPPWTDITKIFLNPVALLPLGSAALFACSSLLVKRLNTQEEPLVIVIWVITLMMPLSLGCALPGWQTPALAMCPLLAAVGILYTLGQFALTFAFRDAPASFVAPFNFARLPFSVFIGWMFFNEMPTTTTWIGSFIIAGASVALLKEYGSARPVP